MARLNACGVEADAFPTVRQSARKAGDPRRGLTLRVQADAVPTARPVCEESKATAASIGVAFPHPRVAAPVRAPLRVCGGGSRGYKAASDITRCWPQASCLSQARCAASMPRKTPRPSNPRYVNGRQHVLVLHLRAAPAAQCLASCTRCARLRAIHGLRRTPVAARLRPRACPAPSAGAGARARCIHAVLELAIHGSPASSGVWRLRAGCVARLRRVPGRAPAPSAAPWRQRQAISVRRPHDEQKRARLNFPF